MKVLIVSPTYNESKNISKLIKNIFATDPSYHILIVDDNSPDGTAAIVEEIQKDNPNVNLAKRPGKAGLGSAYCYGFTWAIKQKYDIIVQMDADLSHNPEDIPDMIEKLNDNDLVIGSRYADGISVVRWPLRRLVLSYGANVYSRIVTGISVCDLTGGFKVWRRQVLENIELETIKSQGYSFQIEMNYRTKKKGYRVIEHPIIFIDRTIGESKMSKFVMFEAMYMVWRLRFSRWPKN
jgi:dolichol-phosphate mannosyltransferase